MAKNPDDEMLKKMDLIAKRLAAKVQGDEGEIYGADGQPIAEAASYPSANQKSWWRFW